MTFLCLPSREDEKRRDGTGPLRGRPPRGRHRSSPAKKSLKKDEVFENFQCIYHKYLSYTILVTPKMSLWSKPSFLEVGCKSIYIHLWCRLDPSPVSAPDQRRQWGCTMHCLPSLLGPYKLPAGPLNVWISSLLSKLYKAGVLCSQ